MTQPTVWTDVDTESVLAAIEERDGTLQQFTDGEILRRQGFHYRDLFLVVKGRVAIEIDDQGRSVRRISTGPGNPIGEIGFLNGCSATATVVADGEVTAVRIDDQILSQLESENPHLAGRLLRVLAETGTRRLQNSTVLAKPSARAGADAQVEVLLCRSPEMLHEAQRLRHAIYCGELGRSSPHADHDAGTIADDLDRFAHVFVARSGSETIGTIRANNAAEGEIGLLAELYGMRGSRHFPGATSVVTKFAIAAGHRGGVTALKLIAAVARYADNYAVRECYIDCVPGLLHYYRALGFEICGPAFLHRENGNSVPMRLDVERHARRLGREPGRLGLTAFVLRAKIIKLTGRLGHRFGRAQSTARGAA